MVFGKSVGGRFISEEYQPSCRQNIAASSLPGGQFYQACIRYICLGVRSIEHPDVLSEKINFSAPGGPKSAKFDPGHIDPIYFEVGSFSALSDPP